MPAAFAFAPMRERLADRAHLSGPFTAGHLLGADQYGRDLLARIL